MHIGVCDLSLRVWSIRLEMCILLSTYIGSSQIGEREVIFHVEMQLFRIHHIGVA